MTRTTCSHALSGREIALLFIELPDRDELPDYYVHIKLPISIDTIEGKLNRNEYPTVSAIEGDFKRMISNAKEYNEAGSVIFDDAERIRKLMYNFMKANNPAYKQNPNYVAIATPIPKDDESDHAQNGRPSEPVESEGDRSKRGTTAQGSEPPDRKSSIAPSATTGDADGAGDAAVDFQGKSFQEAQQMIISHLLHYTDVEYVSRHCCTLLPSLTKLQGPRGLLAIREFTDSQTRRLLQTHPPPGFVEVCGQAHQGHPRPCAAYQYHRLQDLGCIRGGSQLHLAKRAGVQ